MTATTTTTTSSSTSTSSSTTSHMATTTSTTTSTTTTRMTLRPTQPAKVTRKPRCSVNPFKIDCIRCCNARFGARRKRTLSKCQKTCQSLPNPTVKPTTPPNEDIEHIESICSFESELTFMSICSIRIRSRN